MSTNAESAAYQCPAYLEMKPRWTLCRDVAGGTETIRNNAETYLPRFEAEDPNDWARRVGMTFVYDAFSQAVNALVGLALKHGVKLGKDVQERITLDWENIDGQGTHGDLFAQSVLDAALTDGHAGMLAEFPAVAKRLNDDEAKALGIRAYLVKVTAGQIINWRTVTFGGQKVLSLLVLKEEATEAEGDFGVVAVIRYRVYRWSPEAGVTYQLYSETKTAGATASTLLAGEVGTVKGPKFIPFAPVYGGHEEGFLRSKPPLLGLAYSNIDHTQVKSERRYSLHVGAIPWRVVTGVDPDDKTPIIVSASNVTRLGVGAEAKIVEPTGAANGELLLELKEIEKRMAGQGLAMLQADDTAERTATEARLDDSRGKSKLWRASRSLQDAIEACLGFMASYYGLPDGGSVTIRRDFGEVVSPDQLRLLAEARARGDLTLETFLRALKSADYLPDDVEPEQEAEAVRRELGSEPMGGEGDDDADDAALDEEIARLMAKRKVRKPAAPVAA